MTMTLVDEWLIAKSIEGCWREGDLNGEKTTMRHSQLSMRRDLVYVRGMVTTMLVPSPAGADSNIR